MSTNKIHPTAFVDKSAELFGDVEVGPFCTVGPHVKIGKGSRLLSHVVVDGWTTLGERNQVYPFSVIGAVPQDLKYKGERTSLVIGDDNTIRESVTMNLGTVQGGGVTRIGNGNLFMAYVHVGHDCTVGNRNILANSVQLAGHVTVDDYANLGGLCAVIQYVHVGSYSYVGALTAVEKDVPPYSIAVGRQPSTLRGANIVGLRRRGFSSDVILQINEAIKLWTRPNVEREPCLKEIEAQFGDVPELKVFLSFIRDSKQGVVR